MQTDSKNRGNRAAVKPVDDAVVSEVKTPVHDTQPVFAIVTSCVRLNLRETANLDASVLKELPVSTKVQVDVSNLPPTTSMVSTQYVSTTRRCSS